MTISIKWRGQIYETYSFGEVSRNYILSLDRLNVPIKIYALPNRVGKSFKITSEFLTHLKKLEKSKVGHPYANITFEWPMHARMDNSADKNIIFFPIEHDKCNPEWVDQCSWADEIWVPSDFNYIGSLKSGFNHDRMSVIPHGVDTARFNPSLEPIKIERKSGFNFLAISNFFYRKGFDILIKAFAREFSNKDDVCLIIKTNAPEAMFKKFSHYFNSSDSPQVTLITRQFDTHEMPRLYKSADCFVLPSRGEGWGMCYLEAMACGLPTIASRYSGNLHFMNDQNSLLVNIQIRSL